MKSPSSDYGSSRKKQLKIQNEIRKNERLKEKKKEEAQRGTVPENSRDIYNNRGLMIVGSIGERNTSTIGAYFPDLIANTGGVSPVSEKNNNAHDNDNLFNALIDDGTSGIGSGQSGKNTVQKTVPYSPKQIMFDLGVSVQRQSDTVNTSDASNLNFAENCVALLHGGVYLKRSADAISFDSFKFAYEGMKDKKERNEYLKLFIESVADYYSDLIDIKGVHNFENQQTVAYLLQINGPSPFNHKSVNLSYLNGKGDRRGTEDLHNVYLRVLSEGFSKLISSKEKDAESLDAKVYQDILSGGKYTVFLKTRK